jgi:hypothetical protein
MASVCATIIGLGAVGRQVAVQLAAIGVRRMQLIDFDQVEPSNLSTQAYFTEELGTPKVVASRRAIGRIDPSIVVDSICDRYRPKTSIGNAVFCCVDNIASRATIWRTIEHRCDFWADGRMLGEVIRVLIAADATSRKHYATTLFSSAEAQVGQCTARSTVFAAAVAGGLLVHQFARWLRDLPIDADASLNLLAGELIQSFPTALLAAPQ